ncbi:carcinoembryonic antigen-related cell adhesion molecule 19 [Varanus komodoensis]|uniref:carcinoembryonic antigen-related cell adhesion molecule 19 n=1 Tax=Varanus komodoensis TaxID=61221 RepID=UPI001CF7B2A9|nr:carcinoembryonic antigen-related cell adhesion molecule 19 [Varanus komodoensis]
MALQLKSTIGTAFKDSAAAALLCSRAPPSRALARDVAVAAIPALPAEGQNVTLSVLNATGAIREVSWFRGRATDGGARIFSYFPGNSRPQRNGAQHTQRELGFPNGSMLIGALRPSDQQPYTVVILVRPKATFKGTVDLQLASSQTTSPPPTTASTETPGFKEPAKVPSRMGWIVAAVVVGILLAGALGATLVYRFVLHKAEPGTGMVEKLDPRMKMPAVSKHGDKEPIYEVMDSPAELPKVEGKEPLPMSGPLPPLPRSCSRLDSNYMELLRRAESIYSEIKR